MPSNVLACYKQIAGFRFGLSPGLNCWNGSLLLVFGPVSFAKAAVSLSASLINKQEGEILRALKK